MKIDIYTSKMLEIKNFLIGSIRIYKKNLTLRNHLYYIYTKYMNRGSF